MSKTRKPRNPRPSASEPPAKRPKVAAPGVGESGPVTRDAFLYMSSEGLLGDPVVDDVIDSNAVLEESHLVSDSLVLYARRSNLAKIRYELSGKNSEDRCRLIMDSYGAYPVRYALLHGKMHVIKYFLGMKIARVEEDPAHDAQYRGFRYKVTKSPCAYNIPVQFMFDCAAVRDDVDLLNLIGSTYVCNPGLRAIQLAVKHGSMHVFNAMMRASPTISLTMYTRLLRLAAMYRQPEMMMRVLRIGSAGDRDEIAREIARVNGMLGCWDAHFGRKT